MTPMTTLSSNSNDIQQEFLDFLSRRDIRRRNWESKTFYYPPDIEKWMSHDVAGNGQTNAMRLLLQIYSKPFYTNLSFPRKLPVNDIKNHPLLFAILVQMGCGHMIRDFATFIRDDSLANVIPDQYNRITQSLRDGTSILPEKYKEEGFQSVISEFNSRRWSFCPGMNILQMAEVHIEENHILPLFSSEVINEKGGTANVQHFKIQEDLLGDSRLKQVLKRSDDADPEFGKYYEFAVKTYQQEYNDIYNIESEAFRGFNSAPNPEAFGVVKYLGEYTCHSRSENSTRQTRHIMLELGEYDLDEYLADKYPPVLNGEIIAFWKSIFEVARTLQRIHQFEHEGADGKVQSFSGWHGDIKPDNILRVGDGFKLADFGFTKFKKSGNTGQDAALMLGGTLSYGSPERDRAYREKKRTPHLQTIDTWSFGCVLSAVATWVILGSLSYNNYNKRRGYAIRELHNAQSSGQQVPACEDAFHDGHKVLPQVLEWHTYLRNSSRRADTISSAVLDLVDQDMLVEDPERRLSSTALCKELDRIVSEAESTYRIEIERGTLKKESEETLKALLRLDNLAPSIAAPFSQLSVDSKRANDPNISSPTPSLRNQSSPAVRSHRVRKSVRFEKIVSGKTVNREEVIKTGLGISSLAEEPEDFDNSSQGPGPPLPGVSVRPPTPEDSNFNPSPEPEDPVDLGNGATPFKTFSHQEIAIVQEYHRRYQSWAKNQSLWDSIVKKARQEDGYISQYISNRDIIFIVDNAATMKRHWEDVKTTVLTLAMMIGTLDKDGLDLIFTLGSDNNVFEAKGKKMPTKFEQSLSKAYRNIDNRSKTDMATTLAQRFDAYKNYSKKQTLLVLTDGLWEGSNLTDDVENLITQFVEGLKKKVGKRERRWFSIQFISFGNSKAALERLRKLDDELKTVEDVVDTKPWYTDNVESLILGSILQAEDAAQPSTSGLQLADHTPSSSRTNSIIQPKRHLKERVAGFFGP